MNETTISVFPALILGSAIDHQVKSKCLKTQFKSKKSFVANTANMELLGHNKMN